MTRQFLLFSNRLAQIQIQLATEDPFSVSLVARASATPQLSCVNTMVPPIGKPSATAGQVRLRPATDGCRKMLV